MTWGFLGMKKFWINIILRKMLDVVNLTVRLAWDQLNWKLKMLYMNVIVEVYAIENFLTENTKMSPATWKYCNDEHSVMFTSVLKDSDSSILRIIGFVNSVHCGILNRICLGNWICCLFSGENGRETPTWFDQSERTNVNHWTTYISKTGYILITRPWTQSRHSVIWGVMHWKCTKIPGHTA